MASFVVRAMLGTLTAGVTICSVGCVGNVTSLLNPQFLSDVGVGSRGATLPGDAPALLVEVENRTSKPIMATVSYRTGDNKVDSYIAAANAQDKIGRALDCSIAELTLGSVTDLESNPPRVILGDGLVGDPFIEVEPFGVLLREGSNYDCGDAVTFAILPSGATRSGYQVYAYIQRAGQ